MARTFTGGNRLSNAALSSAPSQDCTSFARIKPSWSSGDSAAHAFWTYYSDANDIAFFVKNADNNIYAGAVVGGALHYLVVSDAGLFTAGTWANWRMEVEGSAGITRLYKNGSLVGSGNVDGGTFAALPSPGSLTIGYDPDAVVLNRPANADIAEVAGWDHILSGPHSTLLEFTGNPSCIPTGLVRYWKILGDDSPEPDEIGSDDLTLVGTPPQATHPTVLACAQTVTLPLLAAAGEFYQPTITPGAVTVTLPLLEAAGTFYAPTVSQVRPPGILVTASDSLAQG